VSVLIAAFMSLSPGWAAVDPVSLKLSFFTSDRSHIYQDSVKPFMDAVSAAASGLAYIDVYFSGGIAKRVCLTSGAGFRTRGKRACRRCLNSGNTADCPAACSSRLRPASIVPR
jgi:hypothetical protein